jgi:hypothetical protein
MNTAETVTLTDKKAKKHIKFIINDDGMFERWESKDKKRWKLTNTSVSIDEVMSEKETIKSRNIFNLYNLIFRLK